MEQEAKGHVVIQQTCESCAGEALILNFGFNSHIAYQRLFQRGSGQGSMFDDSFLVEKIMNLEPYSGGSLRKGWKHLGGGRHRDVFRLPSGNVIKFPIGEAGEVANLWEALVWKFRNRQSRMPLFIYEYMKHIEAIARCRMIPRTKVLIMEFVDREGVNPPSWTYRMDCAQVGLTKSGHLVAYDFAEFRCHELRDASLAVTELAQTSVGETP
ncbi:hypothetical protein LCGC14_0479370 [marine sediment metagenome]|uniref:Uncharacterized protein n=1 Tax=marine sediment metagenome TaxID=412755 RepID=A0A0F9UWQ2_9ZZZZ